MVYTNVKGLAAIAGATARLRIVSSSLLMYATNQQKLLLYAIPVIISEPVHWKKPIIQPL
jgi:hypothetical protein